MVTAANALDALPGVRHVSRSDAGHDGTVLVTADVLADTADAALQTLAGLRVPAEDIALVRLERIAPLSAEADPLALVWADLLGQAHVNARTAARYLVFMAVAGGDCRVRGDRPEPDPDRRGNGRKPRPAADHGNLHRFCASACSARHARPGLAHGGAGRGMRHGVCGQRDAESVRWSTQGVHPAGAERCVSDAYQLANHPGCAGRRRRRDDGARDACGAAVGVAISVTTIPASAFLGVAAGIGELSNSLAALEVLPGFNRSSQREAGVSAAVGVRWFREGGGMPTVTQAPLSGRYLSLAEREEVAILRARGCGVREIGRSIGRSPSPPTVSCEDTSRTVSPALSSDRTGSLWPAPRCAGVAGVTAAARIAAGGKRGARSRSLTGCRSISPMMSRSGSRTRRSTRPCKSRAAERCGASSRPVCGPGGRCAFPEPAVERAGRAS